MNTAARLESAAPADGVLVDAWTYRATSRAIRYDRTDPVDAKGKAERVSAWVAVDPVSTLPDQQRNQCRWSAVRPRPTFVWRLAHADYPNRSA